MGVGAVFGLSAFALSVRMYSLGIRNMPLTKDLRWHFVYIAVGGTLGYYYEPMKQRQRAYLQERLEYNDKYAAWIAYERKKRQDLELADRNEARVDGGAANGEDDDDEDEDGEEEE